MAIEFRKDGPWELPEGWVWARLGGLGNWTGGGTPSKSNPAFWEGGAIPWVSPKDMKVHTIDKTVDFITEDAVAKSSTKLIPKDSVLMVVRSGILNHTFPVAISAREVTLNQDMRALTPLAGIDSQYLSHVLKRLQRHILDECSKDGTTVASVEPAKLEAVWVPIAPAAEQRRIVARIDGLFTEIADGETAHIRARADLDTWRRALLKAAVTGELTRAWRETNRSNETGSDLFDRINQAIAAAKAGALGRAKSRSNDTDIDLSDLPEIPSQWKWARVGEIGIVSGGITQNANRTVLPRRLPFLRVANVQYGKLDLSEIRQIGVTDEELDRVLLNPNDLLVVEGNGSVDQIGRCAIWNGQIEPCIHQNHIIKVRFALKELSAWAFHWLMSPHGRQLVTTVASSTSGLHTLSLSKIEAVPIPIPPNGELAKILAIIEAEGETETSLEHDFAGSGSTVMPLRQSILKAAFEGRLVGQDAADEPADRLLAHLQASIETTSPSPRRRWTRAEKAAQ